jgi:hypothetical protein
MAYLLIALLRRGGIEARPALINLGPLDPVVPELALPRFNHCIAAIPMPRSASADSICFFDPTAKVVPWGRVPPSLEGRWALLLGPAGGYELYRVPDGRARDHRVVRRVTVTLGPKGAAVAHVTETYWGAPAYALATKIRGESVDAVREGWSIALKARFPAARLAEFGCSLPAGPVDSLRVSCDVLFPTLGTRLNREWLIPVVRGSAGSVRPLPPGPRVQDVDFGTPSSEQTEVRFEWPESWEPGGAPSDTAYDCDPFLYHRTCVVESGSLVLRETREVRRQRVPKDQYDRVLGWNQLLLRSEREQLSLTQRR